MICGKCKSTETRFIGNFEDIYHEYGFWTGKSKPYKKAFTEGWVCDNCYNRWTVLKNEVLL